MNNGSPLLKSIDRATTLGSPSQILIRGRGCIDIYPQQQAYATDIADLDLIVQSDSEFAHSGPSSWPPKPAVLQPLPELRWRAAYNFACQEGERAKLPMMVRLHDWPDLTEVPEELAPVVARVCALLACKPTASQLVPRIVATPEAATFAVLRVLVGWHHVVSVEAHHAASTEPHAGEPDHAQGKPKPAASLLSKVWLRLTAGRG